MKLAQFLSAESIEPQLQSTDRSGVLSELAALSIRAGRVPAQTDLVTILENREELGSTGIGEGVAIPHVRLKNLAQIRLAVGLSKKGIDFDAIDGRPVHIFFLLLAPEDSAGEHLKALARISRVGKKAHLRRALLEARTPEEILQIIVDEDGKND